MKFDSRKNPEIVLKSIKNMENEKKEAEKGKYIHWQQ